MEVHSLETSFRPLAVHDDRCDRGLDARLVDARAGGMFDESDPVTLRGHAEVFGQG